MSTARPAIVGVLGAYGGVGAVTARQLHAWGIGPLRVGGRDAARAHALCEEALDGSGEPRAVDAHDERSLQSFCDGCDVVVNCAGPALDIGDTVALAAGRSAAHYVDSGGDEPLHAVLRGHGTPRDDRVALLSAGMQPGLSALLPRALAARSVLAPRRLVAYAGGTGRFTHGAAVDYLAALGADSGVPLGAWRDGAVAAAALAPRRDVRLPGFAGRVNAHPFLTRELCRVAVQLGLREAEWYTVFEGAHVPQAIERRPAASDRSALERAARSLASAAALDAFGRDPGQVFAVRLDGHGLLLRATEPIALTGAVTAVAAAAVLEGQVAPGLAFAGEVLPPDWALARLRAATAVLSVDPLHPGGEAWTADAPLDAAEGDTGAEIAVEEGVL